MDVMASQWGFNKCMVEYQLEDTVLGSSRRDLLKLISTGGVSCLAGCDGLGESGERTANGDPGEDGTVTGQNDRNITEIMEQDSNNAHDESITIDGQSDGRRFDGVGAVSAGASSRLLYDYPEPERSQILDYLFKPGYGAALQLLKVEIGADTNSTSGSELSHMREPGEIDCDRGYEWWLMKEAKKRNPDIELAGLEWGAPGWIEGGFWSQDNIDYLMTWLDCAEQQGLDIDYVGGWNEKGYEKSWYKDLASSIEEHYPDTQIIAADSFSWDIATDMQNDPEFLEAVDIIGMHFICGHRSEYDECSSTGTARDLDIPLWMSENSSMGYNAGAGPIARGLNRMYIDADVTSFMSWSPISAWYANLPLANTGLMLAEWPWSGYYDVGKDIWAKAHTTQFTEHGWQYLDNACGYLASGASYVSLQSEDGNSFSTIIETMDAEESTTVRFSVTGGLSSDTVHVWSTDLDSGDDADHFVHEEALTPEDGGFSLTLQPNHIYSLTTTTGQGKGSAQPNAHIHQKMELPYSEDFQGLEAGDLAPYFSDINGAFEAAPCAGDRDGMCYRQQTSRKPIAWNNTGEMDPTTIIGDPRWWRDYEASTSFLMEEPGHVEVLGRISTQESFQNHIDGYFLRVSSDDRWKLYSNDRLQGENELAAGEADIETGTWHTAALRMHGSTISVVIDGKTVATVTDTHHTTGNAGLRVGGWKHAQFSDVEITPIGQRPEFVPQEEMTATATSQQGFDGVTTYEPTFAVDDRPESAWKSDPDASLPQSITVDLGSVYETHGLTLQPLLNNSPEGMITEYTISLSTDGSTFEEIENGHLPASFSTKIIKWPQRQARYVRLEAVDSEGCPPIAGAAEINVATTSLENRIASSANSTAELDFELVPQGEIRATATSQEPGYEGSKAIDGDCATMWHTAFRPDNPELPQSITLDLGGSYDVDGIKYRPRQDGDNNGIITQYNLFVSSDGEDFTEVARGSWLDSPLTKTGTLSETRRARYVKLQAVDAAGAADFASAAEINVIRATDSDE